MIEVSLSSDNACLRVSWKRLPLYHLVRLPVSGGDPVPYRLPYVTSPEAGLTRSSGGSINRGDPERG